MKNTNFEILDQFLNYPLSDSTQIHDLFATLPGAVVSCGPQPMQRFVYVPGTKENAEEKGKHGANYLRKHDKKLFWELNRHRFMMEFDWQGTDGCLYNQVENTQAFKDYIADRLGFQDSKQKGGCDLQVLCKKVCGVNIGVGYHNCHRPTETLVVAQWENTYNALSAFLQQEQPKFPIPASKRLRAFFTALQCNLQENTAKIQG